MISNQCSIEVIPMINLYRFLLLIIQINLESICHVNHPNIKLSIENGCLPFLYVHIFRENDKFAINVCRKKTFSGVCTNFKSFPPETYKTGLINSSLFPCFSLRSDFIKFHHEIDKSKIILHKNSYPRNLVDKCIKEFLDKYWHLTL